MPTRTRTPKATTTPTPAAKKPSFKAKAKYAAYDQAADLAFLLLRAVDDLVHVYGYLPDEKSRSAMTLEELHGHLKSVVADLRQGQG